LAVANAASDDVAVLLGDGDGIFHSAVTYSAGSGAMAISVEDFNGDGQLDLVMADQGDDYGNGSNVSVLLGNGDGTFQAAVNYAAGNYPWSITVGDFNGAGRLDLAVVNQNDNDVSVLLGNGDGTFQPAMNYAVGSYPHWVVVGDFNGDGT